MQKHLGHNEPLGAPTAYDRSSESIHEAADKDDPISVLNMRLAKGDITIEQYDDMKKVLHSSQR
jgi:uncharacterized membrane protein